MRIPSRVGCPIRRSRDQRSLASPPGFSQRATPFIASQCQGIHQMPLIALECHTQRQGPARYRTDTAGRNRQVRQILLLPAKPKAIPRFRRSEDTSSRDPGMPSRKPPIKDYSQAARAAKLRFARSRYGHTTRFFTIVNQQHAPAANQPPKAIPNSSPRYAPVALP